MPLSKEELTELRAASIAHQARKAIDSDQRRKKSLRRIALLGLAFFTTTLSLYAFAAD
jgi:hypothetical protein